MLKIKIDTLKGKLLTILVLIMMIYSSYLIYCQSICGVSYWDIFVYLQNAMLFSHTNIGSQLSVPPIISLLTAIPFSLGFVSETSLFVVSGILFIFLVTGIYLIFNEKFSSEISFVGSIIFSMLSLVVTWAVTGSNDLPALTFSVWSIYFTIQGLNKNFKYYYIAFICFILAFFTRFTEGFVFIILLSYLFMNLDKFKKQAKDNYNLVKLVAFMVIICSVICGIYLLKQGTIPFLSQFMEVSSSSHVSNVNVGYELNPFYYIQHLPSFLTSMSVNVDLYDYYLTTVYDIPTVISYVIIILSCIGLISFLLNVYRNIKDMSNKRLKISILCFLSIFTIISYTHISYIFSELLFVCIVLLLYKWLQKNINQIDILMILLLGIFFILHSYHPVKVDRYILPTFIPITYFMIIGIQEITNKINIKNKKTPLIILTILLIILIPINVCYMNSITHENPRSHQEKIASKWLLNYDKQLSNENLSSDRGVAFSWYLKKYTYTTIPRVLQANNNTLTEKLASINAKYYIDSTSNTTNIEGYHTIYENRSGLYNIKIYEKN